MRIAACIKRVAQLGDDIEFIADGRDVDPDYLDFALNEWDSYVLEEALRLREAHGGEVVAITVGDDESEQELHQCLAMGADHAVRVWSEELEGVHDPFLIARALTAGMGAPDLVLCGAQSSDSVQGATAAAVAGVLDLPCIAIVTNVEIRDGRACVHRELEGGIIDVVEVLLPAVLSIQTGINEPRYVTLRAIQEARSREIEIVEAQELGAPAYRIQQMLVPDRARAASLGDDAAEVARRIVEMVKETTQ
jgi:electron transfer flavoprotein beta subunit